MNSPSGDLNKSLIAVIEIGSTGIRLLIAELDKKGSYTVLDRAGKTAALGRDVFSRLSISRDTLHVCLHILQGFKELIASYGIKAEDAKVIATSALREAKNRDTFIDRIQLSLGFNIEIVEGVEENRLMYLAVQDAVRGERAHLGRSNSIILEVGGGSTEIMLLRRGKMVAAHSLRIGTVRMDRGLQSAFGTGRHLYRFLEDHVRTTCEMLSSELDLMTVKYIILIGADARFSARQAGREASDSYSIIKRLDFEHFINDTISMTAQECADKFVISYGEAEDLLPGLLTARLFVQETACEEIIVPYVSIREGVLASITRGPDTEMQEEFYSQIVASASSLGRKYHYDEQHSLHVAHLSLELFDSLVKEHGLSRRERLLLEIAAILHDVGMFIKTSGHHRHSEYIVSNSEVFGLNKEELSIVAIVVRYHRKTPPNASHSAYMSLDREDRMIVLKLAAILRVADVLDRGHNQRIKNISIEKRRDSIRISSEGVKDLSLERYSLPEKSDMFEEVFGLKVIVS